MTHVVIIGAGPGGYEAAHIARQRGAEVTIITSTGVGGSCVQTDCVPSKALVATANAMTAAAESGALGVQLNETDATTALSVDLAKVNARITDLANRQSHDIEQRLLREGVTVVAGFARFLDPTAIQITTPDDSTRVVHADVVLIATGARPRTLPNAHPDGERILTWEQLYGLPQVPQRLIVVGSGVTGAEFASAYRGLGSSVVLISSRDRVLPTEDPDAAHVIEDVFTRRGIEVLANARATSVERGPDGVVVNLEDGRSVSGSHALLAVGSLPNTQDLHLDAAQVDVDDAGFIRVDRVSRTSAPGVYAAGDCTGVLMLASVAAMQGRIAMWHALGDAVTPLDITTVSSAVFTDPEIATVGVTQRALDDGEVRGDVVLLPLATNARAKMEEDRDGFVKLLCRRGTRTVAGGVIVGPQASELIHSITLAIDQRLTVDELAAVFTVYPSLSGSIAEAARQLHAPEE